MSAPRIMVIPSEGESRAPSRKETSSPTTAWAMLGWVGLAFFIVGALDLLMTWVPTRFGNPEWEFGTVSRTLDNLPITAIGLTMLMASVAARSIAWAMRATGLIALLLAAVLAMGFLVYLLDVPLALRRVTDPLARSGLKRAIFKAAVQGTLYPTVLATVGIMGIRKTLRARPRLS